MCFLLLLPSLVFLLAAVYTNATDTFKRGLAARRPYRGLAARRPYSGLAARRPYRGPVLSCVYRRNRLCGASSIFGEPTSAKSMGRTS
ncbi:hypothetical protein LSAT2_027800 [Lamellibrachia satsuma]|nr:hypothetical protein LSAT2_027800 [Lamellibrachia satsuma]